MQKSHAPEADPVGSWRDRARAAGDGIVHVFHWVLLALLVLSGAAVVVFAIWQFCSRENGYSLNATTELVSIVIDDRAGERIRLPEVHLPDGQVHFSASLRLLQGVTVTLQRLQKGDVRINLEWPSSSSGARLVSQTGLEIPLDPDQALVVPMSRGTITLAFKGKMRLGQQTARDVEGVLLKGRISIVQKAPQGRARYLISESGLDPGDTPLWQDASGDDVKVAGFVHVDEEEAMQVVAHADANHVTIQRYGGRDYEISPMWWDRFSHDPYLSSSAAVFGFLSGLFLLYETWPKVWKKRDLRFGKKGATPHAEDC